MYDVFEFLEPLRAHLRDVVHHHHRIYAVSLLGLLPQDVIQELCKEDKRWVGGSGMETVMFVTYLICLR